MLSFNKVNNHLNLTLKEPTKSYSENLCSVFNNRYFNNSTSINELLQLNIQTSTTVIERKQLVKNENQATSKIISLDNLEETSKQNPLFLFSECFASNCGLNRNTSGIFRNFMENKALEIVKKYYNTHKKLTYTSYLPGYLFQDIVLLTAMNDVIDFDCNVTINLIGNVHDYLDVIVDEEKNPHAKNNCITYDYYDSNQDRCAWVKLFSYRMIKFLEWLKCIGMHVNLNLYSGYQDFIDECNQDESNMSDLTVGIDYVDQFMESVYDFKILSLCTTKPEGHVISLRTDGIPFFDRQINYHFEIYVNDNPMDHLRSYYAKKLELEKLYLLLKENVLELPSTENVSLFSNNGKQPEKEIIKNGKVYKEHGMEFSSRGSFIMYETDEYQKIKKLVRSEEWNMYLYFDMESKKCNYMYDLHGVYKILFNMVYYAWKDRLMSIFE